MEARQKQMKKQTIPALCTSHLIQENGQDGKQMANTYYFLDKQLTAHMYQSHKKQKRTVIKKTSKTRLKFIKPITCKQKIIILIKKC